MTQISTIDFQILLGAELPSEIFAENVPETLLV